MTTFRSLWISDVHLGSRACKADVLADFLARSRCRQLYLVGDILDLWCLRSGWHWTGAHGRVIGQILQKVRSGTRVVYIPGNHDRVFRACADGVLAGIDVRREAVHRTANGMDLLVVHGDRFDRTVRRYTRLERIGDAAYERLLRWNVPLNRLRARVGLPYWSLPAFVKSRVRRAMEHIERFETRAVREVRARGLDGVVCGHVHHPGCFEVGGIHYANLGDWVENCTALAEHPDGRLELLRPASGAAWVPSGEPEHGAEETRWAACSA